MDALKALYTLNSLNTLNALNDVNLEHGGAMNGCSKLPKCNLIL